MTEGTLSISGTLAVIGGGRMGEAIISGLLAAGALGPADIVVAEPDPGRRDALSAAHGVRCADSAEKAVVDAGVVVLAVKPQIIDSVLDSLVGHVSSALVISIAAGITCARLESHLSEGTAVVRVMPNTPAMIGEGMSVVSGGSEASAEQVEFARELFGLLGHALVIDERHQDAATAISGSGPAYVAIFIDALARAGVEQGLSRDVAQALAVQTVRGTAELIEASGMHPEQLVDGVASPGGTTIAAIGELERGGLRAAIASAVDAAVRRAAELGRQ